ncbi:MAG: preprotein translocase subunit SecE [Clostridia bacterium]|nr:preprotein translocase subunit SecE [Clostridia bacterium]
MVEKDNKNVKTAKEEKNAKVKKEKKPRERKLGKKAKEMTSELKKVTWPTFKDVVKKTGVVLAVVVIFAVVLFGIDTLLGFLFDLLV